MKTLHFLAVGSAVTAGALPSLPAKIILSVFVLLVALTLAVHHAPVGYEDGNGFHLIRSRRRVTARRAFRRAARKILMSWLFSDTRHPVKA